ncbi:MAG TPA: hypothetical protein VGL91_19330 [Acidobacteriota bacterium]|jgi:hypothetical protein
MDNVRTSGAGIANWKEASSRLQISFMPSQAEHFIGLPPNLISTAVFVIYRYASVTEASSQNPPKDPLFAPFVGPLGMARSHAERATLFNACYRPAPEEPSYFDVPEDLL